MNSTPGAGPTDPRPESADPDRSRFHVPDLDCPREVDLVEGALRQEPGVRDVRCDVGERTVDVRHDGAEGIEQRLAERLAGAGMVARTIDAETGPDARSGDPARFALLFGAGFFMLALAAEFFAWPSGWGRWAPAALYAVAVAPSVWLLFPKAFAAAIRLRPDMHLLVAVAAFSAAALGETAEAAAVAILFVASLWLERWSLRRAAAAIENLAVLRPTVALRVGAAGDAVEVSADDIAVGDLLRLRPGDVAPADGESVSGRSAMDESVLTGESAPVGKSPGDAVYAGSLNLDGVVDYQATAPARQSTAARVESLVREASEARAPVQRLVDRFAAWYTPLVLAVAAGLMVVPPLATGASWELWFGRGLVAMLVACPCALVISTPTATAAAVAAAARRGVLVRGGDVLERAASTRWVCFDKTGTLTRGRPQIVDAEFFHDDHALALAAAAAIERESRHPIAAAVVEFAESRGAAAVSASDVAVLPAAGVQGTVDGDAWWIGGERLARERLGDAAQEHLPKPESGRDDADAVYLGRGDALAARFWATDELRPEAKDLAAAWRAIGARLVVILSGDRRQAALRVADACDVDEVHPGLRPEEKLAKLKELQDQHGPALMFGDGVNDAPSLAAAAVGAAMGGRGVEAALRSADVALLHDDLTAGPWLVRQGRRLKRVVAINVAIAIGIKVAVLALGTIGWGRLWMAVASDVGASLVVVLHALTLLRGPRPR